MARKRGKPRQRRPAKRARRFTVQPPAETRAADAITVAWTVSLTTVLLCNLASVATHVLVRYDPQAAGLPLLEQLLLVSGAVIGVVSLLLLPIVYKVRRVPPPPGFVMFGVLISVAPLLVVLFKLFQP